MSILRQFSNLGQFAWWTTENLLGLTNRVISPVLLKLEKCVRPFWNPQTIGMLAATCYMRSPVFQSILAKFIHFIQFPSLIKIQTTLFKKLIIIWINWIIEEKVPFKGWGRTYQCGGVPSHVSHEGLMHPS